MLALLTFTKRRGITAVILVYYQNISSVLRIHRDCHDLRHCISSIAVLFGAVSLNEVNNKRPTGSNTASLRRGLSWRNWRTMLHGCPKAAQRAAPPLKQAALSSAAAYRRYIVAG